MTATTVTTSALARRLRAPDDGTGELLRRHAADLGVALEVTRDWAGQPAVTETSAAELVAAAERRADERISSKRTRQLAQDAAAAAEVIKLAKECARTYDAVLVNQLDAGNARTAELAAWEAAVGVACGKVKPVTVDAGEAAHDRLARGGLRDRKRRKWPL